YTGGGEAFFQLAEMYGSHRDGSLAEDVLRLVHFLRAMPFPQRGLAEALIPYTEDEPEALADMPWYGELVGAITLQVEGALAAYRQALSLAARPGGPAAYLETLREECAGCEDLLAALNQGEPWHVLQEKYRQASQFGKLKA